MIRRAAPPNPYRSLTLAELLAELGHERGPREQAVFDTCRGFGLRERDAQHVAAGLEQLILGGDTTDPRRLAWGLLRRRSPRMSPRRRARLCNAIGEAVQS